MVEGNSVNTFYIKMSLHGCVYIQVYSTGIKVHLITTWNDLQLWFLQPQRTILCNDILEMTIHSYNNLISFPSLEIASYRKRNKTKQNPPKQNKATPQQPTPKPSTLREYAFLIVHIFSMHMLCKNKSA